MPLLLYAQVGRCAQVTTAGNAQRPINDDTPAGSARRRTVSRVIPHLHVVEVKSGRQDLSALLEF